MSADSISNGSDVWLHLDPAQVEADVFMRSVSNFLRLIHLVSQKFALDNNDGENISVSVKVEKSSINIGASISGGETFQIYQDQVIKAIIDGLTIIEQQPERPLFYEDAALKCVAKLGKSLSETGGYIRANGAKVVISLHATANAEKILAIPFKDIGSVEGELRLVSAVKGTQIGIIEALTKRFIKCSFAPEKIDELASHFHKRIALKGFITYRSDGSIANIEATNYRLLGVDRIPTADDVRGIFRGH